MKNRFFLIGLSMVLFAVSVEAQVAVNTDGSAPTSGAILDVKSTAMGLLPPRMTSTQRDNISSPPEGLVIYNTTTKGIDFYNGTFWVNYDEGQPPTTHLCGSTQVYGIVGQDGKTWLDRNLGADTVPTSSTDFNGYGALFQWGRLGDGHECIDWTSSTTGNPVYGTTSTLSSTDVPGHSLFILAPTSQYDWRNPPNRYLWQGKTGINNPCPAKWRVPTIDELVDLFGSFFPGNLNGAYNSPIKMPASGTRNNASGDLWNAGLGAYHWSSSTGNYDANGIWVVAGGISVDYDFGRAYGFSVRCVED